MTGAVAKGRGCFPRWLSGSIGVRKCQGGSETLRKVGGWKGLGVGRGRLRQGVGSCGEVGGGSTRGRETASALTR